MPRDVTEDRVPTAEPRTEALMQGTPEEAARIDRPATQAGKDLLFMLGTHETDDLNMEARILAIEAEASAEGWNRANETMRALEAEAAQGTVPLHRPVKRIRNRQAEERCIVDGEFWPCRAAQPAPPLDVPEWAIARAAYVMHIAGEGEDCDPNVDAGWCPSCWIDASNWLDRSIESPADAEYERLARDD